MKIIFKTIWVSLIVGVFFVSCEKMEDIHADFIKDGEIIYANVPDTLQALPGNNRIQLKWLVSNGNNITKSIVTSPKNRTCFLRTILTETETVQ